MAQAFITRRKGGGGVNKDLPAQVTAFTATADSTPSITLNWVNPTEYWAGTLIVKKAGSAPDGVNDGEKIYNGTGTTYTDTAVEYDTEYFYRAFPYNAKKQYQTEVLTVSATPVEGIPLSEMAEGTLIAINRAGVTTNHYLGKHDYEPELNGYGRQLMIPEDCYDERQWNDPSATTYATSDIDIWQNSDYKALFSEAVQSMMGETNFYYTFNRATTSVSTLLRSVFLLSVTELGSKNDYGYTIYANKEGSVLPIANILQIAYLNGSTVSQWTRSPYTDTDSPMMINRSDSNGNIFANASNGKSGSRPCFTLPATALVNPTPNADGSYTLIG